MARIEIGRWLAGGVVAAVVMTVVEWAMSPVWRAGVEARLAEMGLEMTMPWALIAFATVSLLICTVMIFFYIVATSHFGPGMRTAAIVGGATFIGGFLPGLIDYSAIGIYPNTILIGMGIQGFIELVLAALAGAWVYERGRKAAVA